MSIKEIEVQKKAKELVDLFDDKKANAINHINEVIKLLESIPKLTVCEFEGHKCYGLIDFYKDVKSYLKT